MTRRRSAAVLYEGVPPEERARIVAIGGELASGRLIELATVEPERVRWLWEGRVPRGKLTVLDGDPGLGKSLVTLDLAARVTTGATMPDGSPGPNEPSGVLLLSAEDDPADTIRPRLDAAGANVGHMLVLRAVADAEGSERPPTIADLDDIRRAIEHVGAALVVVDPLMAYLPGSTDSYRDQDVRTLLAPLAALASRTGAAIVIVRHLNKAGGGNPLYRGGGSIGIVGAARSGLLVARDPDDETGRRRVLASTKCNLAVQPQALAYTVETAGEVPRIHWEGTTPHTAAQLVAERHDEDGGVLGEARAWLEGELADGPRPTRELQRAAREAGIRERTLDRAKAALRVRAIKTGGTRAPWVWSLPASPVGTQGALGTLSDGGPDTQAFEKGAKGANPANGGSMAVSGAVEVEL